MEDDIIDQRDKHIYEYDHISDDKNCAFDNLLGFCNFDLAGEPYPFNVLVSYDTLEKELVKTNLEKSYFVKNYVLPILTKANKKERLAL